MSEADRDEGLAPELSERWLAGELDPSEQGGVDARIAADAELVERMYRDLNVGEEIGTRLPADTPVRSSVWRKRWVRTLGGLALFGASWGLLRGGLPTLPSSSSALEAIEPVGGHTSFPRHFRWEALEGARRYTLELRDATGRVRWTASASRPEIDLPAASVPADSLGDWDWSVRAGGKDGSPARFSVRR